MGCYWSTLVDEPVLSWSAEKQLYKESRLLPFSGLNKKQHGVISVAMTPHRSKMANETSDRQQIQTIQEGPRTEPCGTPHDVREVEELKLSIVTLYDQ